MGNPRFPVSGDRVDSPWGQNVAQGVLRRYQSEAERDQDLAGVSPGDLLGMSCVISTGAGRAPQYRMLATPSGWRRVVSMIDRTTGGNTGSGSVANFGTVNFTTGEFFGDGQGITVPYDGYWLLSFVGNVTGLEDTTGNQPVLAVSYVSGAAPIVQRFYRIASRMNVGPTTVAHCELIYALTGDRFEVSYADATVASGYKGVLSSGANIKLSSWAFV